MDTKPVFLFAFANDLSQSLNIAEEWRQTESALQQDADAGRLIFNVIPYAKREDVFSKFNFYHKRLTIFHYGGHSNDKGLDLMDGPLHSPGLATLIGQEQALMLVFLNGCDNVGQVKDLLEQGAPAVIATTALIADRRAIRLAQQFYQALTYNKTIGEAFATAAAFVNNQEKEVLVAHRGLGLRQPGQSELEWGLYVRDLTVLDWQIPPLEPDGPEKEGSKVKVQRLKAKEGIDVGIKQKNSSTDISDFESGGQITINIDQS